MHVIGLTGGIGAGKSTASVYLRALGVRVIDADGLAHQCLRDRGIALRVRRAFGREIQGRGDSIDRRKLAAVTFKDRGKLTRLEDIMHPWIISKIRREIRKCRASRPGDKILVVSVPLLFEKGLDGLFDQTVVVTAPARLRLRRAANELMITHAEVRRRMRRQMSPAEQCKRADLVIRNGASKSQLRKQIERLVRNIREFKKSATLRK